MCVYSANQENGRNMFGRGTLQLAHRCFISRFCESPINDDNGELLIELRCKCYSYENHTVLALCFTQWPNMTIQRGIDVRV